MESSKGLSRFHLAVSFILVLALTWPASGLTTIRVASGLSEPTYATYVPGDTSSLFITEQHSGRIKILRDGAILPRPFLDIGDRVSTSGFERGLLGLAFHPNFANNGYFYVNYTNRDGNTVVSRFTVTTDPDSADPGNEAVILTVFQPYSNHNGGMITFRPADGYLYIGMGDGGSGGDPQNRAQNDGELLGKLLRLNIDGGSPYAIPPDNPFLGPGLPLDEIWAKGLRNPWRFSFDRATHDLYIADVGQNSWEEINFQPADSPGGENYGWRLMEGSHCFNPPVDCDPGGLTYPIYEYDHGDGRCSITGGYVYRGGDITGLQGTYFFADFCSNQIWSFRYDGANITDFQERTAELAPGNGMDVGSISSFAEDASGELYILDLFGGEVFKIVAGSTGTDGDGSLPEKIFLGNYPNPFNSATTIYYNLPRAARVVIRIYDVSGRQLETLVDTDRSAGEHQVRWDAQERPSGIYVYRLDAGGHTEAKTTVLVR